MATSPLKTDPTTGGHFVLDCIVTEVQTDDGRGVPLSRRVDSTPVPVEPHFDVYIRHRVYAGLAGVELLRQEVIGYAHAYPGKSLRGVTLLTIARAQ